MNNGVQQGYLGKAINKSLGFELGGSGWKTVSGGLNINSDTAGRWLFVLHLQANGTTVNANLQVGEAGEMTGNPSMTDLTHLASAVIAESVQIDGLEFSRWNSTLSTIDSIVIGDQDPFSDGGSTLYDLWATSKSVGARTADDDNDGKTNEYEYYFGLDPTGSDDTTQSPKITENSGNPAVEHTARTDNPAVTYAVEKSDDLVNWSPAAGTEVSNTPNPDGVTSRITFRSNTSYTTKPKQFFRIMATEQ